MPELTPKLGIKKPLGNERVSRAALNENYDIIDQKTVVDLGGVPAWLCGNDSQKPPPDPAWAGRCYIATDTGVIYQDTGTAWEKRAAVRYDQLAGSLPADIVSDTAIGERTIAEAPLPDTKRGSLSALLNGLGYMVKAITGKADCRTLPAMNLEAIASKLREITVLTGVLSHGQQIPLPSGYTAAQCKWFVSPYELHGNGWDRDTIRDIYCYVDANRIITCKIVDFNGYVITGKANYMIIGIK